MALPEYTLKDLLESGVILVANSPLEPINARIHIWCEEWYSYN